MNTNLVNIDYSSNNDIQIGVSSIDSLKIRLPYDAIIIQNEKLIDTMVLVSKSTGKIVEDDIKQNSIEIKANGITTRYKIENQVSAEQTIEKYLVILFNSKLLGTRYFEGITSSNINLVYGELINHNIASFTFEDFIKGAITDTDIKVDFILGVPAKVFVKDLYKRAIPKKDSIKACSKYLQKTNVGIQFSLRKTTSFKTAPFLKFYEKIRELENNSIDFYNEYLDGMDLPSELMRIETTIKNKKHFKLLGLSNNELGNLLSNLTKVSHLAFENSFKAHITKDIVIASRLQGLKKINFNDKVLISLIYSRVIDSSISIAEAVNDILNSLCTNKQEKFRHKKRINELLNIVKRDTKRSDSIFSDFLDLI